MFTQAVETPPVIAAVQNSWAASSRKEKRIDNWQLGSEIVKKEGIGQSACAITNVVIRENEKAEVPFRKLRSQRKVGTQLKCRRGLGVLRQ